MSTSKKELRKRKQELCLQCNECCKWLEFGVTVPYGWGIDSLEVFYTAHGCKTKKAGPRNEALIILVPAKCMYLSSTGSGCEIYFKKPIICREYNGLKDPILKDICKWKELELEEGE